MYFSVLIFGVFTTLHLTCGFNNTKVPDPRLRVKVSTNPEWIEKSLERHNLLRSLHNASALSLNDSLSEMSQAWSNYLRDRAVSAFKEHRINDPSFKTYPSIFFDHNPKLREERTGENLYYHWGYYLDEANASLAVNAWYNEIKDYDFNTHDVKNTSDPSSLIGHFTALVWKSTTQMGTAYATHKGYPLPDKMRITFMTANYYPGGNIYSQRKYIENVAPPTPIAEEKVNEVIKRQIELNEIPEAVLVETPNAWIDEAIGVHNEFREMHLTPPLERSEELCKVAQFWANHLLSKGVKSFGESQSVRDLSMNYDAVAKGEFGESVTYFITPESYVDPGVPPKMWYNENRYYDFERMASDRNKSTTAKTEHFEQLLWKGTTHMGIAFASEELETGHFLTFVVANYYPSGPVASLNRLGSTDKKKSNINASGSGNQMSSSFLVGSFIMQLVNRFRSALQIDNLIVSCQKDLDKVGTEFGRVGRSRMKPSAVDEMFPDGVGTFMDDEVCAGGGMMVDTNREGVHADFFNDFGDLFDDDDTS